MIPIMEDVMMTEMEETMVGKETAVAVQEMEMGEE
jgi:hypothetical protein